MDKSDWFRVRSYLHFDSKLHKSHRPEIEKKVTDPIAVARHSFFPFLKYDKKIPKFTVDPKTEIRHSKIKTREICYASHWDSQVYAYYSFMLNMLYESKLIELGLDRNVIAFRKIKDHSGRSKSNIHFANDAFTEIRKMKNCKVYAFDITKFFDTLDAKQLKMQWCSILGTTNLPDDHYAVYKSITNFNFVERDKVLEKFRVSKDPRRQASLNRICDIDEFKDIIRKEKMILTRSKGIPQGSPISATLANIYMLEFDHAISKLVGSLGGSYYRYCDDIFVIVPINTELDVPKAVEAEIKKIGLELNTNKTDEAVFYEVDGQLRCDKGIQYLGFIFDGVSISIRPGAISTYRRKVTKAINRAIAIKITRDETNAVNSLPKTKLRLKKIIRDYSHIGDTNFISYGQRAYELTKCEAIRRQLADLHKHLENEVKRAKKFALKTT